MKEGKHTRKKFKIIEVYSVLIFIVTLFLSVGYAEISDVIFNITGTVEATSQEGVFITEVNNISENTNNSKINYFIGTTLDSTVILGADSTSSMTYEVTLYNNSGKEYIFIGTLTDQTDSTLYDNENIEFSVTGIEEYNTTIAHTQSLKFTITFKYKDGTKITNNTLNSKLNFRFKENPKLVLSNEGQIFELNDIYPDYTSQEYQFTVSNYYSETDINAVPMTYSFTTTIDSPLTAKIYDSTGKEVTGNISIDGDGQTQTTHTYILKIIWDNSNPETGTDYNSSSYANKEFNCSVKLMSIPTDTDYLNYNITKLFSVDINSAPLYFNASPTTASLTIKSDAATLDMTINNYSSDTDYNKFATTYEVSIEGNSDFSFTIDDTSPTNNVITRTLSGGSKTSDSFNVKLMADMANLDVTETLTLKIASKSPYVTEIEIPVTITLHTVTVTLNANGGSVSPTTITVYQDKTYTGLPTPTYSGHTFNGWYTAKTGGTKITTSTTVTTTSSTQTLYAQWTSRLLADYVSVGDYVDYPVNYSNVATNSAGTYIPKDTYAGKWRVLSIEGSGDSKYVRLVSAGVPLSYRHAALATTSGATSVTNLTTNFFGTSISTASANFTYNSCGFKNSSGTTLTTMSQVQSLFTNDYTQTSSGVPKVQAMTKADLDSVLGSTSVNETDVRSNDLLAIPSKDQSSGYGSYYLATATGGYYLWASYQSGYIVYTYSFQGIRPVVTLKTTVETTGQSNSIWQINI